MRLRDPLLMFLLFLGSLGLSVGDAQQPAPPPVVAVPLPPAVVPFTQPAFPVTIRRGTTQIGYRTLANPNDPAINAAVLRAALLAAKPGDLVLLGPGTFDCGKDANLKLPDVTIRGLGPDQTILLSEVISDDKGTSFALGNSTIEDCTLKNDCWYEQEDGRCVGFDDGPHTATIRRCRLWCRDWTVYNWTPHNTLVLEDCEIITGRVGVACENSGDGQDVTLRRCRISGDASLSKSRGATSDDKTGGVFGVIARGGPVRLYDCEIAIKGKKSEWPSYTPRACGVVDRGGGGDGPAGNTAITLYNLRCTVDPNGADPARCADLQLEFDFVRKNLRCNFSNSWGSAANGSLSTSWSLAP